MFKKWGTKFLSGLLVVFMCVAFIPMVISKSDVKADFSKTGENTGLGVSQIGTPKTPDDKDDPWTGNYVYYGNYERKDIKFRVLDPQSTKFGSRTMFLDSDEVLFAKQFSDYRYFNETNPKEEDWEKSVDWKRCPLRTYLNNDFLKSAFTGTEASAIAASSVNYHELVAGEGPNQVDINLSIWCDNYVGLSGDKIFILDVEDVSNSSYGYTAYNKFEELINNRGKAYGVESKRYFLRNSYSYNEVAYVEILGNIEDCYPCYNYWVAPALNVDLSSVIFSTEIKAPKQGYGGEYKLTVKDDELKVAVTAGRNIGVNGKKITVPYTVSGNHADQASRVSVLILDKEYAPGNTNDANIIYYNKLSGAYAPTGKEGTFELPSSLDISGWGTDYFVYILAEQLNNEKETDYASEPVEILTKPKYVFDLRNPYELSSSDEWGVFVNLTYGNERDTVKTHKYSEDSFEYDIDKDGHYDVQFGPSKPFGFIRKLNSSNLKGSYLLNNRYLFIFSDYEVKLDNIGHGKAKISSTKALEGDKISVTATPDSGYKISKITYSYNGAEVDITNSGSFTMPNSDVNVVVVYVKNTTTTVKLSLDKNTANVICGDTLTLKATLTGSEDSVTWKASDPKIASIDKNGKITAKMAGTVTVTASAAGKHAECVVTVLYKDVTNSDEFWYAPTNYLTAAGVVKGYANQTEFRPSNDCTRAQMVTFLYRMQGEPGTKSDVCKFDDVKSTDYFFKPVIWAVERGITTGVSEKKFDPQRVCTRAQTVTFLWRMAGKPEPGANAKTFPDVKKSDYFYKATLWASDLEILVGLPDGTFNPQGKCLRRQMVTFLYKYDKYVNGKG